MALTDHPVGNRWCDLDVPEPGGFEPRLTVSVVIPARDAHEGLGRGLAALAEQTYPAELTDVIVVDDGSRVPMEVPDEVGGRRVRLLRQEDDGRFGAGRARNTGARASDADVLVFLDADIVADAEAVERLVRWHHVVPYAFVTGVLRFVSFEGIDEGRLRELIGRGELGTELAARDTDDQAWREKTFARTHDLNVEARDLFRVVIGASMSLTRRFHERLGGLRELGVRGIEDTEFGYRAQNAGALLVADRTARQWHQGRRFFDSTAAAAAKQARQALVEDLIPVPGFRPRPARRHHRVPSVAVVVDADGIGGEGRSRTLASLRSCPDPDLAIWWRGAEPPPDGDGRLVAEADVDVVDRAAVPVRIELAAPVDLAPDAPGRVLDLVRDEGVGAVHLLGPRGDHRIVARAVTSRARGRAALAEVPAAEVAAWIGHHFGERWCPAASVGVVPAGT